MILDLQKPVISKNINYTLDTCWNKTRKLYAGIPYIYIYYWSKGHGHKLQAHATCLAEQEIMIVTMGQLLALFYVIKIFIYI